MISLEWALIQDGRVLVRRVNLDPDRESRVETEAGTRVVDLHAQGSPRLPQGAGKDAQTPPRPSEGRCHDTLTVGPTPEPREQLLCVSPLACVLLCGRSQRLILWGGEGVSGKVSLPSFSS